MATLTLLTDPSAIPGYGLSAAWSGDYLAVGHSVSPHLSFYRRDGDVLTKLTSPAGVGSEPQSCAWSGDYLAVSSENSPHLTFFHRDGDTLTKIADVSEVWATCRACAWSGDYLAVGWQYSPKLSLFRRDVNVLTVLAAPTAPAGILYSLAWSGDYLAVTHSESPYLSFYRRDGDVLTKLADPTALPDTGVRVAWSGDYLAVGHLGAPYLSFYRRDGDVLTKLVAVDHYADDNGGMVTLAAYGLAWKGDTLFVAGAYRAIPVIYERQGEALVRMEALPPRTDQSSRALALSASSHIVVAQGPNAPRLTLYYYDDYVAPPPDTLYTITGSLPALAGNMALRRLTGEISRTAQTGTLTFTPTNKRLTRTQL